MEKKREREGGGFELFFFVKVSAVVSLHADMSGFVCLLFFPFRLTVCVFSSFLHLMRVEDLPASSFSSLSKEFPGPLERFSVIHIPSEVVLNELREVFVDFLSLVATSSLEKRGEDMSLRESEGGHFLTGVCVCCLSLYLSPPEDVRLNIYARVYVGLCIHVHACRYHGVCVSVCIGMCACMSTWVYDVSCVCCWCCCALGCIYRRLSFSVVTVITR